jgi:hypothetical protein
MQGLLISRRIEVLLGLLLVAVFLTANLITSSRSPVVWQDEVMFADPAANLYLGHGFTTSAWFQSRDSMFAGNSPLHSLCLYPWIGVFGLDVTAVRAFNYALVLAALVLVVVALGRLGLIRSAGPKCALVLLVLCGDGVTYSYRSGRYDCLGMLVVAAIACAVTVEQRRLRAVALVCTSFLVPWAGLQLLPYLALLGLLLLAVRGRAVLVDLMLIGAGAILGLGSLAMFFIENNVWGEFLKSVSILAGARRPITSRLAAAVAAPFTEPSSILLLAALAAGLAAVLRRGDFRLRSPVGVGLLAGVLVPMVLAITGKYARYYCWMAFLPMAASVASELQRDRLGVFRPLVLSLLVLACLVGLPARMALTCREWTLRDPKAVDQVVTAAIRPTDWVYSEYEAYYPAKRAAAALFLPPYAGLIPEMDGSGIVPAFSAAERDAVDLLILKPSSEERTLRYFGGLWSLVGRYSAAESQKVKTTGVLGRGSQPYEIRIYRRQPVTLTAVR